MPLVYNGRPGTDWFRAIHGIVQLGTSGTLVQHLQELLGISASGTFDETTQSALQSFQTTNGLDPNGICDNASWVKLHKTVQEGDYGDAVMEAQFSLGLGLTGVADATFTTAVNDLQTRLGFTPTGILGPDEYGVFIM